MKRHRMTRSVRCLRMKRRYDTDPTVEHAPYVTHTLWPNHQQATAEYIYFLKKVSLFRSNGEDGLRNPLR